MMMIKCNLSTIAVNKYKIHAETYHNYIFNVSYECLLMVHCFELQNDNLKITIVYHTTMDTAACDGENSGGAIYCFLA